MRGADCVLLVVAFFVVSSGELIRAVVGDAFLRLLDVDAVVRIRSLAAVVLLLAGLIGWAMIETLETTAPVKVIVEEHTAQVLPLGAETMKDGMPLRVAGQEFFIASIGVDDYDRSFGVAEVTLPNGVYDGDVVVEQTRPIDFLMESR